MAESSQPYDLRNLTAADLQAAAARRRAATPGPLSQHEVNRIQERLAIVQRIAMDAEKGKLPTAADAYELQQALRFRLDDDRVDALPVEDSNLVGQLRGSARQALFELAALAQVDGAQFLAHPVVSDDYWGALLARLRAAGEKAGSGEPPPGGWSTAQSPAQWAREFQLGNSKAFVKRVREGKIRAKCLTTKSYQVAIDDLPKPRRP